MKNTFLLLLVVAFPVVAVAQMPQMPDTIRWKPYYQRTEEEEFRKLFSIFKKDASSSNRQLRSLGAKKNGREFELQLYDSANAKRMYRIDTFNIFNAGKLWEFSDESEMSSGVQPVHLNKLPEFKGLSSRYMLYLKQ